MAIGSFLVLEARYGSAPALSAPEDADLFCNLARLTA
jgi:hypothetical protein